MDEPYLMSIANFCRATGLGKTTAFKLISQNKLEVAKIGGRTLVSRRSVENLITDSLAVKGS